jgi:hypothetical protein
MQSDIEKKADIAAKKYAKNKGYGPALQFHVALAYRLGYVDSASAREEEYRALVEAMLRFFKAKDNYENHYSNRNANQLIWAEEAARQTLKPFNEKV